MKPKHRKGIAFLISSLICTALLIWYFFPVFAGKWFLYNNSAFLHELNVRPSIIGKLPASPSDEWDNISIDTLSLSLPMKRFNNIKRTSSMNICFISDQGAIVIYDLDPAIEFEQIIETPSGFPFNSYEDKLAILNTQPDNISFFKSRKKNLNIYINLILKHISIPAPGIDEILAVNSSNLKAICIMHGTQKHGVGATITIYNPIENMKFGMTFKGYKDYDLLKSDILNILGSIKMPIQPLNAEKVKADIESIRRDYKLVE